MSGNLQLGEAYGLHFFEPRYRLLIHDVMADQPEEARRGGRVRGEAMFVHANRAPPTRSAPAVLVRVLRCEIYGDGRADVLLMPCAHVWLEELWVRPNSGHLYYARCLRMNETASREMDGLNRQQETVVRIMDRLRAQVAAVGGGGGDDGHVALNDSDDDEEQDG